MKKKILISFLMSCPAFVYADDDNVILANGLYIPDPILRTGIVILLFYVVTGFLLTLIRMLLSFRLKSKMINMGIMGDEAEKMLKNNDESIDQAVKWSLVLLSAGAGFMAISCFPFGWLSVGLLAFCLSMGFAGYYIYLKRRKRP